jgi:D-glycero-D-manno-heptose 1,7-bisphosphate phosphatase
VKGIKRHKLKKCVFLDRDGVINEDRGDYTYRVEDFKILDGVLESIQKLKEAGFLIIVVTNQAGISKGLYSTGQMHACHRYLQQATGHSIEKIYHCPYHPIVTESLSRKPDTLMLEKAIARYSIDPKQSWLVGDAERDIDSGLKMGLRTIRISYQDQEDSKAHHVEKSLLEAVNHWILQ